jgi:hypothetical protein
MSRISLYYGEAGWWVGFAVEIAKTLELPAAVTRDDSRKPLKLSSAVEQYEQERSTAVVGLYNRSMIMLGVRGMRFERLGISPEPPSRERQWVVSYCSQVGRALRSSEK